MSASRITRLLRYFKDILATVLMGVGILLPPPESAKAANPPSTPDTQTIEQRVAAVRHHLLTEQLRKNANGVKSEQTSNERLAQWFNWPNWGNWPNWPNWGNWFNR